MRHKFAFRWLEQQSQFAKPITDHEAMMHAVDNHEKLEAARIQIAMDAPKTALYDSVVGDKSQTISEMIRKIEPRANQQKVRQDLKSAQFFTKTLRREYEEGP